MNRLVIVDRRVDYRLRLCVIASGPAHCVLSACLSILLSLSFNSKYTDLILNEILAAQKVL